MGIVSKQVEAKTVLVTGCAGFIGSHLSETLLSLGYKVIGVDNFDPFYSIASNIHRLAPSNPTELDLFCSTTLRTNLIAYGLSH